MDLKALREEVIEETSRILSDRLGFVPSDESDEWELEYRRQYDRAKQRHAQSGAKAAGPGSATAGSEERARAVLAARSLPELTGGTLEQQRWAAQIREERLGQVTDREIRAWLTRDWTRPKPWIDTSEMPSATFNTRAKIWYADHRKQAAEKAKETSAARRGEAAAIAARQAKVKAAGITPEGLVELIDASERCEPAPLADKLAEITVGPRTLRVFLTADPKTLLVKEKDGGERLEYGIERDDGLVADLKLFAEGAG